jgi:hypothetical protein
MAFPFPPTCTSLPWVLGLAGSVALLTLLTPVAYGGRLWLRPLAYVVAVIQIGNGLLYLVASVVMRRCVPGVVSAPLPVGYGGAGLAYAATTLR